MYLPFLIHVFSPTVLPPLKLPGVGCKSVREQGGGEGVYEDLKVLLYPSVFASFRSDTLTVPYLPRPRQPHGVEGRKTDQGSRSRRSRHFTLELLIRSVYLP